MRPDDSGPPLQRLRGFSRKKNAIFIELPFRATATGA
jgi:hypothetical protein